MLLPLYVIGSTSEQIADDLSVAEVTVTLFIRDSSYPATGSSLKP